MRITEVKHHLDGRVERFDCRLVRRLPHAVAVRFDHRRDRRAGGIRIPADSRTFGCFWRRRPYVLYRIEGPDRRLLAHRFDVVADVRLNDDAIAYTDLLLDVWATPGGEVRVEDEEEVAEFARRGLLSRAQRRAIAEVRDLLLRRHRAIARDARRLFGPALGKP